MTRLPLLSIVLLTAGALALLCPATASAQTKTVTNSVDMKLALVPAGQFVMGSPIGEPSRDSEEVPHPIQITKPFYMGAHEVTQKQWRAVMGQKLNAIFGKNRGGGDDHPMENMEWQLAADFCTKLSQRPEEKKAGRTYRLPTEAEWEYACRAGSTTMFNLGDSLSSAEANFNGNFPAGGGKVGPYRRKTMPVGSFEPNAWGLYDMHGNVAEWCADFYEEDYYAKSPPADPLGPPFGALSTNFETYYRVVRGGCWVDDGRALRSAYRYRAMPKNKYRLIGFRVVCELDPNATP